MPDDIATQFQIRRPMLQHVAEALRSEIADLLSDGNVPAHTTCTVLATEDFASRVMERAGQYQSPLNEMPDQVCGVIEVYEFESVARVESLLAEIVAIHTSSWGSTANSGHPSRELICIIPPQAMPEGWNARADVPTAFHLKVKTTQRLHPTQSAALPLVLYPGDANAPFALIMKGGGIKGLAYVGAIEELSTRYTFNWFVGTSAGAITAILLGAGYTPQELHELMKAKDFRDFFDAAWYAWPFNLVFHHGCHRAEAFTTWLDELLAKKLHSHTRVKLSDLPHRVTVYACSRGHRTMKFDSLDNDADAAYAARCSMSIPLVFTPQAEQGLNTYDGGLHQNYPVEQLLTDHPRTPFISLYLGSETYEPVHQRFVLSDLISIWTEGSDADAVKKYRAQTVIIDPRPIRTLDFQLSEQEKDYLLACGRAGALAHLANGGAEHVEAIKVRDGLKVEVERARNRRRRTRRNAIIVCVLVVAALYAAYRLLL